MAALRVSCASDRNLGAPQRPGRTRAFARIGDVLIDSSSGRRSLEHLGDAVLERLCGFAHHFLAQCGELLALPGHYLELRARVLRRYLDELRRRLHGQKLGRIVEGSVGVDAGELDNLGVALYGALNGVDGRCMALDASVVAALIFS